MTTDVVLVAAPARLVGEACDLLEYGLGKNTYDASAAHAALTELRAEYPECPSVPLPASLIDRTAQALFVACAVAGDEFGQGPRTTRFSRVAIALTTLAAAHSEELERARARPDGSEPYRTLRCDEPSGWRPAGLSPGGPAVW